MRHVFKLPESLNYEVETNTKYLKIINMKFRKIKQKFDFYSGGR